MSDSSSQRPGILNISPPSHLYDTSLDETINKTEDKNIQDFSPPSHLFDTLESDISLEDETQEDMQNPSAIKPLERDFKDMYKISGILPDFSQEDFDISLPEEVVEEITKHKQSRRTVFADQQGLPLAQDNEGQRLRLSQKYEKYKTKPKHVPFSKPPSSGSIDSDPGVAIVNPGHSGPSLETTTKKPITTRSGRTVKKPQMLGEWDTDVDTSPEPSFDQPQPPTTKSKDFKPGPEQTGPKIQRLVGLEHPQYQTPTFSRFQPQKVLKTALPPTPQGVEAAPKPLEKGVSKNPQPQGLLRTPLQPEQQKSAIPDDIHLGDSPPRPRRPARERKPPTRYGFED